MKRVRFAQLLSGLLALTVLLGLWSAPLRADIIETVAGGGSYFPGEGLPATEVALATPFDVAVDDLGGYYIADHSHNLVRHVDRAGVITTVAGGGGSLASGIPALEAALATPCGLNFIRVAGRPYLYVADRNHSRTLVLDVEARLIYALASYNSTHGQTAIERDGRLYLYISDSEAGRIVVMEMADPVTPGPVTELVAGLYKPLYLYTYLDALGTPHLVVPEYWDGVLWDYTIADPLAATNPVVVAGGGSDTADGIAATTARLVEPVGVARDAQGNFYIAEHAYWNAGGNRVRKVDTAGVITTVAGTGLRSFSGDGGPALDAAFHNPTGLALDADGDLLIGDDWNHRVRWLNFKPHAAFEASADRGFAPLAVSFANATRTASGTTYAWDFGDGSGSTESKPSHTYSARGLSTAVLTATGQSGLAEDTTTAQRQVCVSYIFSNDAATATTAPFALSYRLDGTLHARVWANTSDVDWTRLASSILRVRQGANAVTVQFRHEGGGNFSGSLGLASGTFVPGPATASFTIRDRARGVFTQSAAIVIE